MITKIKKDLLIINLLSGFLILVIFVIRIQLLRIIIGIPFMLFFPGYTLIAALFPKDIDLDFFERIVLSFGTSIVIVPLIGLLLNYTPWGIGLNSILLSLFFFIFTVSGIASHRVDKLTPEETFKLSFNFSLPRKSNSMKLDKVVSIVFMLATLVTISTISYVLVSPEVGERYTEFYIIGSNGKAQEYPKEWITGEECTIILGITNHERENMTYRIQMTIGGALFDEIGPIGVMSEGKWEGEVSFIPQESCATTTLVNDVNNPDIYYIGKQTNTHVISVQSTEKLEQGDYIWIEQESAKIRSIENHTITLEEALLNFHSAGSVIIEVEKVEFKLVETRNVINDSGQGTFLSLWSDEKALFAEIENRGLLEAQYKIEMHVKGSQQSEPTVWFVGPATITPGQEWNQKIDLDYKDLGIIQAEFLLYVNGKLLYRENLANKFPTLYLWVNLKEPS